MYDKYLVVFDRKSSYYLSEITHKDSFRCFYLVNEGGLGAWVDATTLVVI